MKTLLLSILAAVTVATAMPAPVVAQNAPPPEDNPLQARRRAQAQGQQAAQSASTRADLIRAVECQRAADAAPLDALLATAPYSAPEASAAEALAPLLRQCNSNRPFTTPVAALRGTVAEALLKARFATAQAARTPPLNARPLLDVAAATTRTDAATLVTSYGMADCMGATQAEQVRGLLATDPGTPAEATYFNATLAPVLGRCAATAGGSGQISVDARTLRGILAEALYRWSVVQRDGPSSPLARSAS
ncbi:MAG TPA: hypothetical protein VMG08_17915 [Allosphingosinicella sp.]|nr:hypothetical protein [Allosphingosinicella sp.]